MSHGHEIRRRGNSAVKPTTTRWRVQSLLQLASGLALAFAASFPAHGFSSAPYFPLAAGNYWTYQKNGGPLFTSTVQSAQLVNGYPTMPLYDSEDGTIYYYSNDGNGIRQHASFTPPFDTGVCPTPSSETDIISPPLVFATPDISLGQVINGSGSISAILNCTTIPLTYVASSTIVGIETITVPLGIFSTVRVRGVASIYYQGVFQYSQSETYWVATNVGPVQSTYQIDSGPIDTYRLTATNVVRTAPDAFTIPPQTGVALNSPTTSSAITVTGTTAASPISITGGQYSINGGAYTSAAGTVTNGQTVTVRQTSSASPSTTTTATLTIGGVSGTFAVTTTSVVLNTLTVQVSGAGSVTSNVGGINCGVTCSANYAPGTMVTLTAAATAPDQVFSGWSGGGCAGTGTCTVTMDAAKTVTATFVANTLTISKVGSGTVAFDTGVSTFTCGITCLRNIPAGGTVTLTATAASNYTFTGWTGGGCSGTGNCVITMNAPTTITATFTFIDTQAPTPLTGLTATPVSGSQINLSWNPSTDNVGVTAYQVFRGGALRATVNAPATQFGDTGLSATTLYSYTVTACDVAGNCTPQSAPVSATTLGPNQFIFYPVLELGFNLISNALNVTLDVVALFGNLDAPTALTANVVTLWKWNAVEQRWAFHSPQLTAAGNVAYAASKNFDVLATINPGEGYWVNTLSAMTLPPQSGTGFNWNGLNFPALPSGFNLITTADGFTPSQFNVQVSSTPPAPGVVPTDNLISLWAWDAGAATWYFYSPLLESTGGLPAVCAYALSQNYRCFSDYGKLLGLGIGFWVNRP